VGVAEEHPAGQNALGSWLPAGVHGLTAMDNWARGLAASDLLRYAVFVAMTENCAAPVVADSYEKPLFRSAYSANRDHIWMQYRGTGKVLSNHKRASMPLVGES
jgi:hypothetical protein